MQTIKMYNMVLLKLCPVQQVPDDTRVVRDLDPYGIFHCPHRGQIMGVGSDATGTLNKKRGITRVPAFQYILYSPKHLSGTPGIDHLTSGHLNVNSQMAFYPCNRIDRNSLAHFVSSLF